MRPGTELAPDAASRSTAASWEATLETIDQAEIVCFSTVRTRPAACHSTRHRLVDDPLDFSTGPDGRRRATSPSVRRSADHWRKRLTERPRRGCRGRGGPRHQRTAVAGSPQPEGRSGTGDGNTRSVRMAFDTTWDHARVRRPPQRKSLPSPRAASATPDIASEAPRPHDAWGELPTQGRKRRRPRPRRSRRAPPRGDRVGGRGARCRRRRPTRRRSPLRLDRRSPAA